MTPAEIDMIYSNDYMDFILSYNGDLSSLEEYKDFSIQIINFFLAVVRIPASMKTSDIVTRKEYAEIPSTFGLVSEKSLEASGITRLRNIPSYNLRGKGVLMGFVDTGIDYTNPIFQNADKTTRIARIWDQTIISYNTVEGIDYGTEYTRDQINEALKSEDPYSIVPSKDENGHGTMIAGIAAGNEVPESGFYGVAPDTELVVVKLKQAKPYLREYYKMPEDAITYQENDLISGVQYLLNYATGINKPIVICISLDTSQYAHDGRGTTSNWLSLMANLVGISIIIPTGNEGNSKRHYFGKITADKGYDTVELNVGPNEEGLYMEIWGTTPNIYSIDITSPSGEYIPRLSIKLNETREINFIFEPTTIYLNYQLIESQSGDQLILLRFSKPQQGIWKFNVYGRGIFPMNFNIWLPMNHYITDQTYFIRSDPNITLLSLACARIPITVTAYNEEGETLYINAGRGYTRINRIKPDVAAPGVNILSPSLNHNFVEVTGTSAAAAHAAGIAAMLFEWGIVNGHYPRMNTVNMKIFFIRGARRRTDIVYPNPEWGYGILDVYSVFDKLRRPF